jgi:4-amino-4-deoxy-L-arabinose transferase-like glycosyltransferase
VSRRAEFALALSIGLLVVAIRAPLMDLPLERDEGGYAYIAWRMTFGETPYLDWFDQKPPGIFAVYRVAISLADDAVVAVRALAAVFSATASIALFYLVRALLGTCAGWMAALLLAFLSADPMIHGSIANTELFMLPGIVIATLLVLRATDAAKTPIATSVAAGLSIGIAIAFKQVAVLNLPFFLLAFGLRVRGTNRWRRLGGFAAWLGVGVAAVWGPILAWLQLRGALAAAIDATILHNLAYAGALGGSRRLELLMAYGGPLLRSQAVTWALAALGGVLLACRRDRFAALFLGGWALANAVGVSVGGHYFPHYFQQLLPAVAALAAAAVCGGRAGVDPPRWRVGAVGCLALAPLVLTALSFWTLSPAAAIQRIYPYNAFGSMPMIASEIESITAADDAVFLFGTEPEILYYARRTSATRYIYLFPLFGRFPDARERQQAVIDEVSSARPPVMLWLPNRMFFEQRAPRLITDWFRRFSAREYRVHAFRVSKEDGGMELLRVPAGVDPNAVLRGRKPSATIFVRNGAGRETHGIDSPKRAP